MKYLGLLILAIALSSCGGTQVKEKKKDIDAELDGLTNESFKWPKPQGYKAVDDFLDTKLSDEPNVLKEESIAKVDSDELEEPLEVPKDLDQALLACYRRDYKLADRIFDQIMKKYRKNPIYWNQVGNCFMMKGSMRKALLYFNKARELRSHYVPPVNNIGVIFEKNGFYQKALKSYEEAKKKSSFSLTPIFNLAQIYARFGFMSEGRKLFNSLVKINNKDQDAIAGLAFFELASGNYSKSENLYDDLSSKYSDLPQIKVNHAYASFMNGNKGKAQSLLSEINTSKSSGFSNYLDKMRRLVR